MGDCFDGRQSQHRWQNTRIAKTKYKQTFIYYRAFFLLLRTQKTAVRIYIVKSTGYMYSFRCVSTYTTSICRLSLCVCVSIMYGCGGLTLHTHLPINEPVCVYVSTYTYLQAEIKIFALGTMHTYALDIILTICAIVLCE